MSMNILITENIVSWSKYIYIILPYMDDKNMWKHTKILTKVWLYL